MGLVCGTCCHGSNLTLMSMHTHDSYGETLCIHSLAIAEKFRRRGYATALLKVRLLSLRSVRQETGATFGIGWACVVYPTPASLQARDRNGGRRGGEC